MPYDSVADLPRAVRGHLPNEAQRIYLAAYNHAWNEYANPAQRRDDATREQTAHKVAWSAVKQKFEKSDDRWVAKTCA